MRLNEPPIPKDTRRNYSDPNGTGPGGSESTCLSGKHKHTLLHESGIDPGVVAERGYRTVSRRAELLDFKKYQRRAPALYIPMNSPDGITRSAQLRPENPRRDKKGKPIKYETAGGSECILDVHPRNLAAVRDLACDLWITEGVKKGDSLASRGACAISLIGVWNWQRKGEMLPCWDHVALEDRRVYVAFDSDAMEKEGVQLALERLVGALKERGADVLVCYLRPGQNGEKVGVDDYLAGGGTVAELQALSRRFEPEDLGRVRLSRDEKLRALVEDLDRTFWTPGMWKGTGGHGNREVFLELIREATKSGKIHPDGVRVTIAQRKLADRAACSTRTVWKSLNRLEAAGLIYRDNGGREADKRGGFVLRSGVRHMEERESPEEKATQRLQASDPGVLHLGAPRLRWSSPKWKPSKKMIREHRLGVRSHLPEPRPAVKRLGKICGHAVDVLEIAGGSASEQQLADALGVKRLRNLRRNTLPGLEKAEVITVEGGQVSLTADWLEALEREREAKGEIGAAELNRQRFEREGRKFSEDIRSFKSRCREERRAFGWPEFWQWRRQDGLTPHWTNDPDADGAIEHLEPAGGDLSPEDAEVLEAVEAFEGKYGRGTFRWDRSSSKELFYSGPISGYWPEPDQLLRIRDHVKAVALGNQVVA